MMPTSSILRSAYDRAEGTPESHFDAVAVNKDCPVRITSGRGAGEGGAGKIVVPPRDARV